MYKGQEFQGKIERVETESDNEIDIGLGVHDTPNMLYDKFGTLETYDGGDLVE